MKRKLLIISSFLFFTAITFCHIPALYCADVILLGNPEPKQGEIFPVRVMSEEKLESVKIRFNSEETFLLINGNKAEGLFGFDLAEPPGVKNIYVTLKRENGDEKVVKRVKLLPANFPVQHIDGIENAYVNPGKEELKRIKRESKLLRKIWKNSGTEVFWEGPFITPFDGFNGHNFGKKRVINGEARNPHTGVDSHAERGTPVTAINNGIVKMTEELYFSGISVVVDHGGGLFSMYFHLEDHTIKEGDYVKKGEVIGHVGSSGRATGPHLHLGVRFVNQRVNPMDLFVE